MQTALNVLTFSRAPLAFLFFIESSAVRIIAVILAMLTDMIDGWLARRYRSTSRFGAILDPVTDKFFVFFILTILMIENKITTFSVVAMLSRDIALAIFGTYLLLIRQFKITQFRSIIWGKVSTALQFGAIIAICAGWSIPPATYFIFIALSALALVELFYGQMVKKPSS